MRSVPGNFIAPLLPLQRWLARTLLTAVALVPWLLFGSASPVQAANPKQVCLAELAAAPRGPSGYAVSSPATRDSRKVSDPGRARNRRRFGRFRIQTNPGAVWATAQASGPHQDEVTLTADGSVVRQESDEPFAAELAAAGVPAPPASRLAGTDGLARWSPRGPPAL